MAYIMSEKNRYSMSEDEKTEREKIKAVHKRLREPLRGGRSGDRYDLLAWAFARGFKFRRCERNHHTQIVNDKPYEHHMPPPWMIWERLVRAGFLQHDREIPPHLAWHEWGRINSSPAAESVKVWLADPAGAIAAPAPKPKKLYSPIAAE